MRNFLIVKLLAGEVIIDIDTITGGEILPEPTNPKQPPTIAINTKHQTYMFFRNHSVSSETYEKIEKWLKETFLKNPEFNIEVIE